MQRIYLISGDGSAAGKTTLAEKLVGASSVWNIAGAMRYELQRKHPGYDWFNKTQAYKETTIVKEYGTGYMTVRQVLFHYGQQRSQNDPTYWITKLVERLLKGSSIAYGSQIAIDDIRKVQELDYAKMKLKNCQHYHVVNPAATREPTFDNPALHDRADYRVSWASVVRPCECLTGTKGAEIL